MKTLDVYPTSLVSWQRLVVLAQQKQPHIRELLAQPNRQDLIAQACGIQLDYTRQKVTNVALEALFALAKEAKVHEKAQAMFAGEVINSTEKRQVLHVALRGSPPFLPWGENVATEVEQVLEVMLTQADTLYKGLHKGVSGQTVCDVVHIGIGGSDLGPRMAIEALAHLPCGKVQVHCVSNPDPWELYALLQKLNPHTTACVIASKTFTTQESLTIATSVKHWLHSALGGDIAAHLFALSSAVEKAQDFGVPAQHIFGFWDWVGGRYSLWSALGFPLAIRIGRQAFSDLLRGARAMDQHFLETPVEKNLPVLLALFGVWNCNFGNCQTHAVVSYAARLRYFPSYLQQLEMESNGKSVQHNGKAVACMTAPIVWGGLGIDGQHAYFQLLHQGSHVVPMDFIGVRAEDVQLPFVQQHNQVVRLNMLAQANALAIGRDTEQTRLALQKVGIPEQDLNILAAHRTYRGNVPSSVLRIDTLDAYGLGTLIALYEHKVFVQSVIWGINAFDQWGVELGKQMVKELEEKN